MVREMAKNSLLDITLEELRRFEKPVPRYTSYPPSPNWHNIEPGDYQRALDQLKANPQPVSIYIHVPFCKTMCLFCGCHVILNRRLDVRLEYASLLEKEIDLVLGKLGKQSVRQLHLGGGTPTYMPLGALEKWLKKIDHYCPISSDAEISIEVDPRTVIEGGAQMLVDLKSIGFTRLSFGVQDTDTFVQEAVRRRQSAQMSETTIIWARQAGFDEINIDLIYGLPKQTQESFSKTIQTIIGWKPSRIALFSYANVPWLKTHQKAIREQQLPSSEQKLQLYLSARTALLQAGYEQIGMDHFALPQDSLTQAYYNSSMQRNFQGYSLKCSDQLIGLGVSATGFVSGVYVQNVKGIDEYATLLASRQLPVARGKVLSPEDHRRHWVLQRVMCDFGLKFSHYNHMFARSFMHDFAQEWPDLIGLVDQGLVEVKSGSFIATAKGRVFIRLIAAVFDTYLRQQHNSQQRFSMSI